MASLWAVAIAILFGPTDAAAGLAGTPKDRTTPPHKRIPHRRPIDRQVRIKKIRYTYLHEDYKLQDEQHGQAAECETNR